MQDIPASEGGVDWCADSKSTEEQFSVTVLQGLQIQQRQSALTVGQTNAPYTMQFTATGAASPTWTVSSGSLPAGLTLSSTGTLSGTPTATGDYSFKITASSGSASDTQTYTLSIVEPLKINNAPAGTAGEVGLAFTLAPNASGGKQGYTWTLTGNLPPGLTFDPATGSITGRPTAAGTFPVSIGLKDALGLTQTANVSVVIASHVLITKRPLKAAKVGKQYSARLIATGGVRPLTWNILGGRPGIVPPGLRFNRRTGTFSGIPTKAGTYRLRIQAVDKLGVKSAIGIVITVK
jgi:large repetitive protein